jgi:hypothetical protein
VTGDVEEPIVWIAPAPPQADQTSALSEWALARGRVLVPPPGAAPKSIGVDLAQGNAIEDWLDDAYEAIASQDARAAERDLSAALEILVANPALPSAAWLRAEVDRARSTLLRHEKEPDARAADDAWMEAEALDGGRIAGVGEEPAPAHPALGALALERVPAPSYTLVAPAHAPAPSLAHALALARTWIDGRRRDIARLALGAGPHAMVEIWNDEPVAAAWIDVVPGGLAVAKATAAPACSDMDLGRAHLEGGAIHADGVQCPRWIAASVGLMPTSVRIASCGGARCEALLDWRVTPPWAENTPAPRRSSRRGPSVLVWGLAGAGVAVMASVAVAAIASGAFPSGSPQTRWVQGPLQSP